MREFGLLVMAKAPQPGQVKTRLCPPFTHEQAAVLAAAALRDTVGAVRQCPAASRLVALDWPSAGPIPGELADLPVIRQQGADLGGRLDHALACAWSLHPVPHLVIGMDTPQVTAALLQRVATSVSRPDQAVLGRAADGGFWCLAFGGSPAPVLHQVPMSRSDTADRVESVLRAAGYGVAFAPQLEDVDDAGSAARVAALAPSTHFARAFRSLVGDEA